MKKPSTLWKVVTVFIAIFVGSILVDSWILQPETIDHVCKKINVGSSISDVFTKAKEFNLRTTEARSNKGQKYITIHGGSFNRHVCEIEHDDNKVIKKEFKKMNTR